MPEDINLTRALTAESTARGLMLRSQTTRNIMYGGSALALAIGVGAAAIIYANNQKLDIEALKLAVLQMPELKVATIPALTIESPPPLKLEQGTVTIAEGGTVGIDPDSTIGVKGTVKAEGTVTAQVPAVPASATQAATAPDQPVRTSGGEAIKREVTVFNEVRLAKGAIITGWTYANGESKTPTNQYCYYTQPRGDGTEHHVDLAVNRVPDRNARKNVPNLDTMLSKCVWFAA
ncbi:hypothetical protein [Phyllobacterium lublinensis]|uniref:hypothetical protein n=1 Tax=Phyllobacterium lublinensis TaxID=2875708 RepID=UPI001CC943B3|nr:hypothetical protein [Phyllobacterium sp. 2063]MBZ9653833.1 hypothetical protein [Phyllobacterium sp. 2063]